MESNAGEGSTGTKRRREHNECASRCETNCPLYDHNNGTIEVTETPDTSAFYEESAWSLGTRHAHGQR